jgi:HAD superfamily hydrolase (TIGR01509 family)
MDSLEIILASYRGALSDEQKLAFAERKNSYYRGYLAQMSPADLNPDVRATLDAIKARGIKEAVASSSKNTKFILRQIGLEGFFDAVSDGTNITRSKPDPEVFIKAGEFVKIAPRLCLAVEDAKSGVQAALAANMDCAAVGDATKYRLATYNLDKLSDLLNLLD